MTSSSGDGSSRTFLEERRVLEEDVPRGLRDGYLEKQYSTRHYGEGWVLEPKDEIYHFDTLNTNLQSLPSSADRHV